MEIIQIILGIIALGLVYSFGFVHGSHLGFCAREYHNPVVIVASPTDDSFLAHDFTDKSFLGQAPTVEKLGEMIKAKYPDKTIVIAEGI